MRSCLYNVVNGSKVMNYYIVGPTGQGQGIIGITGITGTSGPTQKQKYSIPKIKEILGADISEIDIIIAQQRSILGGSYVNK